MMLDCGWHVLEDGRPVQVATKAWTLRTPEHKHSGEEWTRRTTWTRNGKRWQLIELKVEWADLGDPRARLSRRADQIVTMFEREDRDVPRAAPTACGGAAPKQEEAPRISMDYFFLGETVMGTQEGRKGFKHQRAAQETSNSEVSDQRRASSTHSQIRRVRG